MNYKYIKTSKMCTFLNLIENTDLFNNGVPYTFSLYVSIAGIY